MVARSRIMRCDETIEMRLRAPRRNPPNAHHNEIRLNSTPADKNLPTQHKTTQQHTTQSSQSNVLGTPTFHALKRSRRILAWWFLLSLLSLSLFTPWSMSIFHTPSQPSTVCIMYCTSIQRTAQSNEVPCPHSTRRPVWTRLRECSSRVQLCRVVVLLRDWAGIIVLSVALLGARATYCVYEGMYVWYYIVVPGLEPRGRSLGACR